MIIDAYQGKSEGINMINGLGKPVNSSFTGCAWKFLLIGGCKMSVTELNKEIKSRMGELTRLDNTAKKLKQDEKYEEYQMIMNQLMEKNREAAKWIKEILSTRADEICRMFKKKNWPAGIPPVPGAVTEPSYPEVIQAVGLIPDYELKGILSPECFAKYKGVQ